MIVAVPSHLTSLWGCPLLAPPALHQHRGETRWSYICPSFCLHQNSAWGREQWLDRPQTSHTQNSFQQENPQQKSSLTPRLEDWCLKKNLWHILGEAYQICLIGRGVCRMATRAPPWFRKNTLYSSWKTCRRDHHHSITPYDNTYTYTYALQTLLVESLFFCFADKWPTCFAKD